MPLELYRIKNPLVGLPSSPLPMRSFQSDTELLVSASHLKATSAAKPEFVELPG